MLVQSTLITTVHSILHICSKTWTYVRQKYLEVATYVLIVESSCYSTTEFMVLKCPWLD